jgi:cation diffusion facilitator CzcD-associated flavoprotein CzcO
MYRFHPSVNWSRGYPNREEILSQLRKIWEEYDLKRRTRFNTKVEHVSQDKQGRWIINDPSLGRFAGLVVAIGTCGHNKVPHIQGMDRFQGAIRHSSDLDDVGAKGRSLAVIGGGASAVEALELAISNKAKKIYVLSRSDKWIIPRNAIVDVALSWNLFGQETLFSWIPETLLRRFFYRDLQNLAPEPGDKGIFEDTPMVNSDVLDRVAFWSGRVGPLRHRGDLRQGRPG